jgi:hypothetical protein
MTLRLKNNNGKCKQLKWILLFLKKTTNANLDTYQIKKNIKNLSFCLYLCTPFGFKFHKLSRQQTIFC